MSVIFNRKKNVPIHERLFFSTPPYYLGWFEKSYHNVPLNQGDGTFCLQCMNVIQGTKPVEWIWNQLIDAVVTILQYNKRTIDHAIYIKVFSDETASYLTVSTDNVLDTNNNATAFIETRKLFREDLRLKSKKDMCLNTLIIVLLNLLLDSVLIRMITSWRSWKNCSRLENLEKLIHPNT